MKALFLSIFFLASSALAAGKGDIILETMPVPQKSVNVILFNSCVYSLCAKAVVQVDGQNVAYCPADVGSAQNPTPTRSSMVASSEFHGADFRPQTPWGVVSVPYGVRFYNGLYIYGSDELGHNNTHGSIRVSMECANAINRLNQEVNANQGKTMISTMGLGK